MNQSVQGIPRTVTLQPGSLGLTLDFDTGLVKRVMACSQAERAGLTPGLYFHEVNGSTYEKDVLMKHVNGHRPYRATFVQKPGDSTVSEAPRVDVDCVWEANTETCSICGSRFGIASRRHHCRLCGRCVCNACSPSKVRFGGHFEELQRACTPCVEVAGRCAGLASSVVASCERIQTTVVAAGAGSDVTAAPVTRFPSGDLCRSVAILNSVIVPNLEEVQKHAQQRLAKAEQLAEEQAAEAESLRYLCAKGNEERRQTVERLLAFADRLSTTLAGALPQRRSGTPSQGSSVTAAAPLSPTTAADSEMTLERAVEVCERAAFPAIGETIRCLTQFPADQDEVLPVGDWEVDTTHCSICKKRVGKRVMNPRHHCRICGRCVCAACSPSTIQRDEKRGPERVCKLCVIKAFRDTSSQERDQALNPFDSEVSSVSS
mmetsp:Transcript_128688/g.321021  ORF Transcript_128688/g.321021 Transcript_128688/m.321021 type:complete len:432 (-) Transcript_128688:198-1493(-)